MNNSRPLATLSIGNSEDLSALGYGPEHVDSFTVRLVSLLLSMGFDIGYGGDLRSQGFNDVLNSIIKEHELASNTVEENAPVTAEKPCIFNYIAWPYYESLSTERIAETFELCRYITVPPLDREKEPFPEKDVETAEQTYHKAIATSRMRQTMVTGELPDIDGNVVPASTARIVLAGKIRGWSGILPGIAEEALLTLEHKKPVYLIGCFGGATRVLCDAFSGVPRQELTYKYHSDQTDDTSARATFHNTKSAFEKMGDSKKIKNRFSDLYKSVDNMLGGDMWVDNGLTRDENKTLFYTQDEIKITRLIKKGIENLKGPPGQSANQFS